MKKNILLYLLLSMICINCNNISLKKEETNKSPFINESLRKEFFLFEEKLDSVEKARKMSRPYRKYSIFFYLDSLNNNIIDIQAYCNFMNLREFRGFFTLNKSKIGFYNNRNKWFNDFVDEKSLIKINEDINKPNEMCDPVNRRFKILNNGDLIRIKIVEDPYSIDRSDELKSLEYEN